MCIDEKHLSLKDLRKIQNRLPFIGLNREQFQEEKKHLDRVLSMLSNLEYPCSVLGLSCKTIVAELQLNLCRGVDDNSKYIVTNGNNDTENLLVASIKKYQEEKIQRMKKVT